MKFKRLVSLFIVLILTCITICACAYPSVTSSKKDDELSLYLKELTDKNKDKDKNNESGEVLQQESMVYGVGDLITVSKDGEASYLLSIDSVLTTEKRNKYGITNPEQVVTITYSYWNLAEDAININYTDFKVADMDGNLSSMYLFDSTIASYETPKGVKCSAKMSFGIEKSSDRIKIYYYDNIWNSTYDFIFDVSTNEKSDNKHEDIVIYEQPKNSYKVGDTIVFSENSIDLYSIKINNVKKIKESPDSKLGYIWTIEYVYENIGIENDIISNAAEFTIVDLNGNTADFYNKTEYFDVSKCPKLTPKGTKCTVLLPYETKTKGDKIYIYFFGLPLMTDENTIIEGL